MNTVKQKCKGYHTHFRLELVLTLVCQAFAPTFDLFCLVTLKYKASRQCKLASLNSTNGVFCQVVCSSNLLERAAIS